MTQIKLEVGKRYVDRSGQTRGPLRLGPGHTMTFECPGSCKSWFANGSHTTTGIHKFDLIALVPDEAPEPQPDEDAFAEIAERELLAGVPDEQDELAALGARVAELEKAFDKEPTIVEIIKQTAKRMKGEV